MVNLFDASRMDLVVRNTETGAIIPSQLKSRLQELFRWT